MSVKREQCRELCIADVPQGDDNELCVLRTVLDVVRDDGDVAEVKSGVDLVHEVQRSGLVNMQCEDERQRAQSLE